MATIDSPTKGSVSAEVDPSTAAARVSIRPIDHVSISGKVYGHYSAAFRSGAVTGTSVAAASPVFAARWTDSNALCLLTYLEAYWIPTVVFTAAQELGLDAIRATGWTAADSAGTQVAGGTTAAASLSVKQRTTMGNSLWSDMRISSTTLLTAGTRNLDSFPFDLGGGVVNVVNAAAATAYVNPGPQFGFRWEANMARGEYPMVFQGAGAGQGEGFLVRNTVVFPAAGTATLAVKMKWIEVAAF